MDIHSDPLLVEIEAVYAQSFPRFLRVARAVLGDRERAIEAVQDGFADAIRSRWSFRGEVELEGWIWRVVVNAARKAAREPLVEVVLRPDYPVELPPALPELTPVLAALPERQRLIVFLRYYADLDYQSIADVLGLKIGTVGATLTAARSAVRQRLEEVESDG
jgi:RNA polymerase sigma-70 factor (ECF subfamily)